MSIKNHKDYLSEINRLEETKKYLENTIGTVVENRMKFNEDIRDAYIHLDHLDSSLSYSSIVLNSDLLDVLEKNFDLLIHARKKPYFARMDIKQSDKEQYEEFYIGKVSLFDSTLETPLVIDWRAPVASVYYDGRLGKASYTVGDIEHSIDLLAKRQYTIEDGQLIDFMDVDISTTDTFLQASLESHAGEKLKDIVSTIQAEQNRIIRADIDKPLIVQGAAGSGKTTIALHRIAYLIYTYADDFSPEEFMIIAPNTLFLDYISSVLPELGANKVKQTTYIDLMFKIIGKKINLTDLNYKLNELIRTDKDTLSKKEKYLIRTAALFKNSMEMKDKLDQYILELENKILPSEDFYLEDYLILSLDDIKRLYFENYRYLPLYKRVDSIKKYITSFTRNKIKDILKNIDEMYSEQLDLIRNREPATEERRLKIVSLMDERDSKLERIRKSSKTIAKKYMGKFYLNNLFEFYFDFIANLKNCSENDPLREVYTYIGLQNKNYKKKKYEIEDLAPLVYFKSKVFGLDNSLDIQMVVIDEAQDFSDFQFFVLRQLLNTERFTILGDISQGIHMYRAIENWEYLKENIFEGETNYLTLEQSYRTTIEIMNEANFVLDQLSMEHIIKAKPVVRHGEKPSFKEFNNEFEIINEIINQVEQWNEEMITTMAIITKTSQEAKLVFKLLEKHKPELNMLLVDEKTEHFDHQILVIPAYLAKGLEFDVVIVTAVYENFEIDPLDIKLIYVAMTRAMHRLSIIARKNSIAYYRQEVEEEIYVS